MKDKISRMDADKIREKWDILELEKKLLKDVLNEFIQCDKDSPEEVYHCHKEAEKVMKEIE